MDIIQKEKPNSYKIGIDQFLEDQKLSQVEIQSIKTLNLDILNKFVSIEQFKHLGFDIASCINLENLQINLSNQELQLGLLELGGSIGQCINIKKLKIIYHVEKKTGDEFIQNLFTHIENCKQLTTLDFEFISDQSLDDKIELYINVIQKCQNLKFLFLNFRLLLNPSLEFQKSFLKLKNLTYLSVKSQKGQFVQRIRDLINQRLFSLRNLGNNQKTQNQASEIKQKLLKLNRLVQLQYDD